MCFKKCLCTCHKNTHNKSFQSHVQSTTNSVFIFISHTVNPALRVCTSVNYHLFCDDPVSLQSLVSWGEKQSRLVELKDALLSRQYTSRSAFPSVLTPASQGVLNLLCGVLQRPPQVSRNQDWASSSSSHSWHTECLSMC